jgi:hypothetical protein
MRILIAQPVAKIATIAKIITLRLSEMNSTAYALESRVVDAVISLIENELSQQWIQIEQFNDLPHGCSAPGANRETSLRYGMHQEQFLNLPS